MRFDLHLRASVGARLAELAERMKAWDAAPRFDADALAHLRAGIQGFSHSTVRSDRVWAGIDGSGDFPSIAYADSFVHVCTAQATCYAAHAATGLKEVGPAEPPVVHFAWVPGDEVQRTAALDEAFEALVGESIDAVIQRSDYRRLKERATGQVQTVDALKAALIRPLAADAANIGIQLRSTAELSAGARLLRDAATRPDYLFVDTTLALPFVQRRDVSLFFEHVKRLLCVLARTRGACAVFLSKSHGLPGSETIEEEARVVAGLAPGRVAEHWYLRLPSMTRDGRELPLDAGRRLPPVGAVSYLVRFHRTTPVLRVDLDESWWEERIASPSGAEVRARERQLFEDLDYACHDQRCFGYPYPIKAGHDRASLTQAERVALRKQIVDAAVRAGMRRSLFRDPAQLTGHQ